MSEFKKLETPKVSGKNVYPYSSTDPKTNEVEFFSEKGKKAIENQRKSKWC